MRSSTPVVWEVYRGPEYWRLVEWDVKSDGTKGAIRDVTESLDYKFLRRAARARGFVIPTLLKVTRAANSAVFVINQGRDARVAFGRYDGQA